MTKLDLERTRRRLMGVTTDADRDAKLEEAIRYRAADDVDAFTPDTIWYPPGQQIAALTSTNTPGSGSTRAIYIGRAQAAYGTISAMLRVTTDHSTVTWAEVGIATGTPVLGGGADLTLLGFTSVVSAWGTIGVKTHAIEILDGAAGEELWFLYGAQATNMAQFRVALADDLQSGQFLSAAVRPSTMAVNEPFTVLSGTTPPVWLALSGT